MKKKRVKNGVARFLRSPDGPKPKVIPNKKKQRQLAREKFFGLIPEDSQKD